MTRNVWHKRFHGDALTGYMGLTLEQRGAYTTLLDLMYDSGGALGIPDRDRWIAGHLNVSVRRWRTLRDDLLAAGKIDLVDGLISNNRYRKERENSANLSRKRAESGASGGEKSGETRRKAAENRQSGEANASDLPLYARATEAEAEAEAESEEEEEIPTNGESEKPAAETPSIDREGLLRIAQVCARTGGVTLHPERPQAFVRELDVVKGWVENGVDIEKTAIPTIAGRLSRMKDDETVGSLRFFDSIVRKAHAKTLGGTERTGPSEFDDKAAQAAYLARLEARPH